MISYFVINENWLQVGNTDSKIIFQDYLHVDKISLVAQNPRVEG